MAPNSPTLEDLVAATAKALKEILGLASTRVLASHSLIQLVLHQSARRVWENITMTMDKDHWSLGRRHKGSARYAHSRDGYR